MNVYNNRNIYSYTPKRVWIDRFSRKPSPLKVIFWVLVAAAILIFLGNLSLKAVAKSNAAVCQNWNETSRQYKTKGYVIGHSIEDIRMCEDAGVQLFK